MPKTKPKKPAKRSTVDALYRDWDAFMPRDAKASKLTFTVTTPTGPLPCTLRFQFCCYLETARYSYVGDTLRDAVKSFIAGDGVGVPHPGCVFEPASLKIVHVPAGYARADVKAKLAAILAAAFPPG